MSGTDNGTEATATPQDLHLVYPANGEEGEGTRVRYTLAGNTLVVNFEVTTRDLTPVEEDDGEIYNGNVVEIFVCTTAATGQIPRPYYEFEVSRYDQKLEVLIEKDGHFNESWTTPNFKHSVTIQKDRPGWDATMQIPLKDLGWNGDLATLVGNAFSILGPTGGRRFYSAYLPPQPKPNFHLPNFFKTFPISGAASENLVA
jgi:hypothetical protein